MRIVCVSDTHGYYDYANLPEGDVLVHAGDMTVWGKVDEVARELDLISKTDFKHKVIIAGNHDFLAEDKPSLFNTMLPAGIHYLQDDSVIFEGLKFYGMPWVPGLPKWAFSNRRINWLEHITAIPDDTDILITHCPSYGILDFLSGGPGKYGYSSPQHLGSHHLGLRVDKLSTKKLKAHIFGHIHDSHGINIRNGVYRVNAAICDEMYKPTNLPEVIEV